MPKHKTLRSATKSLADSFTSTLNYQDSDYVMSHISRVARETGVTKMTADLLSEHVTPDEFLTAPIVQAVSSYGAWLTDLVRDNGSDMKFVKGVQLTVEFDDIGSSGHFLCVVSIKDDRGTLYEAATDGIW